MDKATLKALKGSISKWESIVAGSGADNGCDNCPLCKKFYKEECNGCPVREASGQPFCDGTPYDKFRAAGSMENKRKAAELELAFLRSLLPAS